MSRLIRRNHHVIVISMLFLALLLAAVRPTAACEPLGSDRWFVELIIVDSDHLPSGITGTSNASDIAFSESSFLTLTNKTVVTVTLLTSRGKLEETLPVALPDELRPARHLGAGESTQLYINELMAASPDLINQNRWSDDRPATVTLPASQKGQIHLASGDRLITVPFTLDYALNPSYDPVRLAKSTAACDRAMRYGVLADVLDTLTPIGFFAVGVTFSVVIIGLGTWLLFRWIDRRSM